MDKIMKDRCTVVPNHWKEQKIKYVFDVISGATPDTTYDNFWDGNITWITPADMIDFGDIDHGSKTITRVGYNSCGTTLVPKGSVVVSNRAPIGKVNYAQVDLCTSQGCKCIASNTTYNRYFFYLLYARKQELIDLGRGTTFQELSTQDFKNFKVLVPPLLEQKYISDYLDKKCAEIDNVIRKIERQIEKLNDYKKSLIQECVTNGLDKTVKLKNSGVKWIGDIPSHWNVRRILQLLKMPITDGPHVTPEMYDSGVPFVSAEAVSTGNGKINFNNIWGYVSEKFYLQCCRKYKPEINDIYMIKSGATTGRVAMVDTNDIFTIWSPLAVFRCNSSIMEPRFMFYSLQTDFFQKQVQLGWTYGTQQNIGMRTLEHLKICLPPLKEQKEIIEFLDRKLLSVDFLIEKKNSQLEHIKQYKSSLIYEYVTGKKRVKVGE